VAIPLRDAGKVVIGIEPLRTGVESLIGNGIVAYQGTLEDLAFPDASIDAIGIFDVLEHIEYPEVLLSEVGRVLKPGGALIVSVPANQYLFSDFDLSIGHFRRYSRKTLENLLTENGFKSNRFEYLFLAFVVPAFILRSIPYRFGRRRRYQNTINSNNKLSKIMELLRPLLEVLFRIEGKFRLPTGLSLISLSFKPD
jgi:SAM-dependent methyltransferase